MARSSTAVTHDLAPAGGVGVVVRGQKRLELGGHGLLDDPLRAIAHQIGQLVGNGWIGKGSRRIVGQGGGTSFV